MQGGVTGPGSSGKQCITGNAAPTESSHGCAVYVYRAARVRLPQLRHTYTPPCNFEA
jgi:hypothetical protein